jgi:hypothetical protein
VALTAFHEQIATLSVVLIIQIEFVVDPLSGPGTTLSVVHHCRAVWNQILEELKLWGELGRDWAELKNTQFVMSN